MIPSNLLDVFKRLDACLYAIIKLPPEFPDYQRGSDIDIFCMDISDVSRNILAELNGYVNEKCTVEVTTLYDGVQLHIDLLCEGKLEFRFDLYGQLPVYQHILVKPAFFESLIERRQPLTSVDGDVPVFVPSNADECLVRYMDYLELYATRPDKVKHLDYIEAQVASLDGGRQTFFVRLEHYIEIPRVYQHEKPAGLSLTRKIKHKIQKKIRKFKKKRR